MAYLGESQNEHGTAVSVHRCDTCGGRYTICPAVPEAVHDQWDHCLGEDCESYQPTRDADLYFGLDMVRKSVRYSDTEGLEHG